MFPWQPILAILIVLFAAAWLIRRALKTIRAFQDRQGHLSDCGSCQHKANTTKVAPLVQLEKKMKN